MPAATSVPSAGAEVIVSLSPCCGASAKGGEFGIICRNCYQPWDDYGHETYERVAVLSDMGGIDGPPRRRPSAADRQTLCNMG